MTDKVEYRKFKATDIKDVAEIVRSTWFYGETEHKWVGYHTSLVYLYHCLARHDFSQVAIKDGKVIGFIFGHTNHSPFIHNLYTLAAYLLTFRLFLYKEGRESLQEQRQENHIDHKLLTDTNHIFGGELILFIVGDGARGLGVGSTLFQKFLDYQSSNHSKDYFLYTDDGCNVDFYKHKGLTLVGTYPDGNFNYYIYQGKTE